MTHIEVRTVALDGTSAERLAAGGLEYRQVDAADDAALDGFIRAAARGFLEAEPSSEALVPARAALEGRRLVGVYDDASPQRDLPVATVCGWATPLTVPGGEVPMWAISDVTVAPTHRRRGVARAMLEGELRAAADAGLAIAGLTVSEATIYSRYGFGPATWQTRWKIDTRRAGWVGPEAEGSLQFLDQEGTAAALGELHERTRRSRIGDIAAWPERWRQIAGASPGEPHASRVRGVRFVDGSGAVRGAMAYRIVESDADWARSTLDIRHLIGETAPARAALWRFAIQHDLIGSVSADLRSVDEPLPWMLADSRAAERKVADHGWLRILDVPAALSTRTLAAPLAITMRVTDPLGFADGVWLLEADGAGSCRVRAIGSDESDITLGVAELSSLYLGGASARALAEAGKVSGDADALGALDAALRADSEPFLSISY
ncbi:GNAT family N-acetyltransferase [Leucobacter sp. USHLN153]|uniref:GNAT family N-acetyltransferase n=1 Tax=Leucobacter sp. USHLN153 TaxID=3081268 RepID=UPI0030167AD1